MERFLTIVSIVVIIWLIIKHIIKKQDEENARQYRASEEERLRKDYPDGYAYYKNYRDKCSDFHKYLTGSSYLMFSSRDMEEMISLKTEIINKQQEINARRKKAAEEDEQFAERQKRFSSDCITIAKTHCQDLGRYLYGVSWEKRDKKGNHSKSELSVWHFFVDSMCLDQDLDYSLFSRYKENFDNLSQFKNMTRWWNSQVYGTINNFIEEIAKLYPLGIVFDTTIKDWDEEAISYHYKKISREIPNTRILDSEFYWLPFGPDVKHSTDVKFVVFISCFTKNISMKSRCENIFKNFSNPPCVVYLSLLKCFDRDEMQELIEKEQIKYKEKQKLLRQEEKERLRKETEIKIEKAYLRIKEQYPFGIEYFEEYESLYGKTQKELIIENEEEVAKYDIIYSQYLILRKRYPRGLPEFEKMTSWDDGKNYAGLTIEEIIQFEDRISKFEEELLNKELQQQKENQDILHSKVNDWKLIHGCLHYRCLLNYFPMSCDFEANKREWEDRWTVWNFKNTLGKTSEEDHQEALSDVIPRINNILTTTFGKKYLKYLTLVCIPASTVEKTSARYKEFSERLCKETGMINAYNYTTVVTECEEKKFGGSGITTNNVSFNENFFKAKCVLLFDDVITKGESMLRFKRKLESLGAVVIAGMSIGKTKHEKQQSNPIDIK